MNTCEQEVTRANKTSSGPKVANRGVSKDLKEILKARPVHSGVLAKDLVTVPEEDLSLRSLGRPIAYGKTEDGVQFAEFPKRRVRLPNHAPVLQ